MHDVPPPPHWPPGTTFLTRSRIAKQFDRTVLAHIRTPLPTTSSTTTTSCRQQPATDPFPRGLIKIQRITLPSHPANGQLGLVAVKHLEPRTRVMAYLGEYHTDVRPESDYDLTVVRQRGVTENDDDDDTIINIGLDASSLGNAARFINDYRGIADRPNCEFKTTVDANGWVGMSVYTLERGVPKGQELLVSYGKGWWAARRGD